MTTRIAGLAAAQPLVPSVSAPDPALLPNKANKGVDSAAEELQTPAPAGHLQTPAEQPTHLVGQV